MHPLIALASACSPPPSTPFRVHNPNPAQGGLSCSLLPFALPHINNHIAQPSTAEMHWCPFMTPRFLRRPLNEKHAFPLHNPHLAPCKGRSKWQTGGKGRAGQGRAGEGWGGRGGRGGQGRTGCLFFGAFLVCVMGRRLAQRFRGLGRFGFGVWGFRLPVFRISARFWGMQDYSYYKEGQGIVLAVM